MISWKIQKNIKNCDNLHCIDFLKEKIRKKETKINNK